MSAFLKCSFVSWSTTECVECVIFFCWNCLLLYYRTKPPQPTQKEIHAMFFVWATIMNIKVYRMNKKHVKKALHRLRIKQQPFILNLSENSGTRVACETFCLLLNDISHHVWVNEPSKKKLRKLINGLHEYCHQCVLPVSSNWTRCHLERWINIQHWIYFHSNFCRCEFFRDFWAVEV